MRAVSLRAWCRGRRWPVALVALVGVVCAIGGVAAESPPPAAAGVPGAAGLPGAALAATGLAALGRLPMQEQSVISRIAGAAEARFAPARDAGGFELSGGGVSVELGRWGLVANQDGGRLSMRLAGTGRGDRLSPVAAVSPRASDRVSYSHPGGVTEWYAAGPLGVEQGFTLA